MSLSLLLLARLTHSLTYSLTHSLRVPELPLTTSTPRNNCDEMLRITNISPKYRIGAKWTNTRPAPPPFLNKKTSTA
ncbi:hypothetical protein KC19_7G010700 [Ceratodon purpureus]|uniref:Secreted protein n=1 Tax=Ceratodon purpureus TaxID=3225 RepID=A0A8T0H0U6_CERPU|nr:hypothetical protein KC19_7G010700 [Ceratodon purpureus]